MTTGTGAAGGGADAAASAAPALATAAAAAVAADGDAFPDRPYRAVYDCGPAPDTTHILEVSADDDGGAGAGGQFSGYAACGAAPDGWVWSPSGMVSCKACLLADKAGGARPAKGRRH